MHIVSRLLGDEFDGNNDNAAASSAGNSGEGGAIQGSAQILRERGAGGASAKAKAASAKSKADSPSLSLIDLQGPTAWTLFLNETESDDDPRR